jgi:hypothetical protein
MIYRTGCPSVGACNTHINVFVKGNYPIVPFNVEGFGKNSLNKSGRFINI